MTATDLAGNTSQISNSQTPSVPTITSFSPDTGVVGDGITDPAILTLTGTAVANSTVNVYDGTTLLGTATANASGAWSFVTAAVAGRGASFHRDRHGVWRDQCGFGRDERHDRHGGAGGADHRLVLDRQRHGRRPHHQ